MNINIKLFIIGIIDSLNSFYTLYLIYQFNYLKYIYNDIVIYNLFCIFIYNSLLLFINSIILREYKIVLKLILYLFWVIPNYFIISIYNS